jgi:predicted transporter
MKIISRKLHGGLDYASALILIVSPWLFNFEDVSAAKTVAIAAGILILAMSLLTNYEAGAMKMIPMSMHLNADVLLGIVLLLSPWLFGFSDQTYLFHVIMGLFAIGSGLMTTRASLVHRYDQHSIVK